MPFILATHSIWFSAFRLSFTFYRFCHLGDQQFHPIITGAVNLAQMGKQLTGDNQMVEDERPIK